MNEIIAFWEQHFPFLVNAVGKWIIGLCSAHTNAMKIVVISFALLLFIINLIRTRRLEGMMPWLISAFGCAYLAQIYLSEENLTVGIFLYSAAAILMLRYCVLVRGEYGFSEITMSRRATVLLMALIIACALFVRFYRLGTVPNGINNDESLGLRYALNTMRGEKLQGWWADNMRYGVVYLYSYALFFKLFPVSLFSARALSSIFGILGIIAFFLMVKILFTRSVAVVSAAFFALSFCIFGMDRIALGFNHGTFFMCLSFYLLLLAEKKDKLIGLLSGLALGLALWTFDATKGAIAAFIVFVFCRAVFERGYLRKNWFVLVLVIFGFWLATWPLIRGQMIHAKIHMMDTSVFTENAQKIHASSSNMVVWINIKLLLRMFFRYMSESYLLQRNGPMLNDFLVPLFFLGFICTLYCWRKYNYFLALVWFFIASIPGLLSWPAVRRILIILPAAYIFVGIGVFLLLKTVIRSLGFRGSRAFIIILTAMIILIFAVNTYIYFNQARIMTDAAARDLGEYVSKCIGKRYVYLVDILCASDVYFLTYESRGGENPDNHYRFIKREEVSPLIFNEPPKDMDIMFIMGYTKEESERLAEMKKAMPYAQIEKFQYFSAFILNKNDLLKERGVDGVYKTAVNGIIFPQWAIGKILATEFDWEAYPLHYPFQIELEGLFYVPKDGEYSFKAVGDGNTELSIDKNRISISPAFCVFKSGVHRIGVTHLQNRPGKFSITWGSKEKPEEPIYLWHGVIDKLKGPLEARENAK